MVLIGSVAEMLIVPISIAVRRPSALAKMKLVPAQLVPFVEVRVFPPEAFQAPKFDRYWHDGARRWITRCRGDHAHVGRIPSEGVYWTMKLLIQLTTEFGVCGGSLRFGRTRNCACRKNIC